ncbi:MAG: outer membrane beta-barrel protein [Bacteroidales bacterium]
MKKFSIIISSLVLVAWLNGYSINPPPSIGNDILQKSIGSNTTGEGLPGAGSVELPPASKSKNLRYPSSALFLTFVPSSTSIANSDIKSDDTWEAKGGFGFNFELGYYAKFNKLVGYGFGLGYSSYVSELTLNTSKAEVMAIDIDNDNYLRKMDLNNVVEKLNLSYLDIPIFIEIGNPNIDKLGLYGRVGVKVSFPLSASFKPAGIASYSGYYPDYNVELYGINQLGFYSDSEIYQDVESKMNSVNVSAIISAGVTFPLSNYFILRVGANGNFGLLEISNQKRDDYDVTKYDGNYSKVLENPEKTTTQSFGVEIGLIYNLRLY